MLPAHITFAGRWTQLVRGAWRFSEPIHIMESRVEVMGIRRAARVVQWYETVVVSLCDNLSCALAHEKRRSRDYGLRMTVAVGSAYCLACGFSWHHRYVISEVNPDDEGSRAANRNELLPGEKVCADRFALGSLDLLLPQVPSPPGLPCLDAQEEGRPRRVSRVGRGEVSSSVRRRPKFVARVTLCLYDALGFEEVSHVPAPELDNAAPVREREKVRGLSPPRSLWRRLD